MCLACLCYGDLWARRICNPGRNNFCGRIHGAHPEAFSSRGSRIMMCRSWMRLVSVLVFPPLDSLQGDVGDLYIYWRIAKVMKRRKGTKGHQLVTLARPRHTSVLYGGC